MKQTGRAEIVSRQSPHTAALDGAVRHILWRWRDDGAFWTSDIAAALHQPRQKIYESLMRLKMIGDVVHVDDGNPSSWAYRPQLESARAS